MKYFLSVLILCAVASLEAFAQVPVAELSDLTFLRQGGYVIIFRHSTAPFGTFPNGSSDPVPFGSVESQWWKSCDVNSARQLDIVGRTEAANIGRAIRRLRIPISSLTVSEFCRCYETGVLMNTGLNMVISTALTFTVYTNDQRLPELRTRVNALPPAGTNTLLVTHGHTVGPYPFDFLQWSDAIIYRPRTGAEAEVIGYARYNLWARSTTGSVTAALEAPEKISLSAAPAAQNGRLLVQTSKDCTVSFVNALGEEVLGDVPLKQGSRFVDVKSLPSGVYSIVASNGKERTITKFTKQ
ncbi:MAG: hypothetical protein EAZ92_03895 [Candidatus Kapaibacterium sp.]|nr:MAG: hypothetical protein EAZ92_03895 [Candidatus Kapabacteria bacterium]